MAIVVPKIRTQYITLFNDEESYNAAKDDFIEVNWSAVKDEVHPEEVETEYQPSTRPTHGFEPVDGETVKPDSAVRMKYYTFDHILKTFFLEIIWGYSGWEWKDYDYNGTILKGGNLYKVKEITEVPSIPDGYRLQHINNFLNSQDKVTHVGTFDATNIISMLNAFSVGVKDQAFLLDTYNFPNVEAIDGAFTGLPLTIVDDHVLYLGKVTDAGTAFNNLRIGSYDTSVIKIEMPLLQTAENLLKGAYINSNITELDLNNIFIGDTLNNTANFKGFLSSNGYTSYPSFVTVKLDLTETNIPSSQVIDLSNFCTTSSIKTLDLKVNNPVNLSYVLSCGSGYQVYRVLDIHGNENLITDISHGFTRTIWDSSLPFPYSTPINETVEDSFEFEGCRFDQSISYDFSPNHTLKLPYGHFDGAAFYGGSDVFYNMEYLNEIVFRPSRGFTYLPNTLWSPNITYQRPSGASSSEYVDYTRFKHIQIGGSISTIAPQTIYATGGEVFGSSMLIDDSINLHICQTNFTLNNNNITSIPIIYFHVLHTESAASKDYCGTGSVNISGSLIENIVIHIIDETDGTNLPYLNLSFTEGCTNIETLSIDADFRCNVNWNITELSNLNMSNFEDFLMHRQLGYYHQGGTSSPYNRSILKCYQSQWDQFSSNCQTHCIDIFANIDLVQEEE